MTDANANRKYLRFLSEFLLSKIYESRLSKAEMCPPLVLITIDKIIYHVIIASRLLPVRFFVSSR